MNQRLDTSMGTRNAARPAPAASDRFTRLVGCEAPIQLAPMAGPGSAELAIAVGNAGGHPMVPAVLLEPHTIAMELDRVAARVAAFGVNFIAPLIDRRALECALERAPLIDFFYGPPDPRLIASVHDAGALASWQVGSVDEARQAEQAGCDLIIAQGTEAGGRIRGQLSLERLLAGVVEAVGAPVLAAGGIATATDVARAIAAGADGVRVGTRFVASAESYAHPAWIAALVDASSEEAVVTQAFSVGVPNFPHRVLRRSLEAAEASEAEYVGEQNLNGLRRQVPLLASTAATRDFEGAVESTPFYAGRSVDGVHGVDAAAEIVSELAAELRFDGEAKRIGTRS